MNDFCITQNWEDIPAKDWHNAYIRLLKENKQLEKALDEASILLEKVEKDCCYYCPVGCNCPTDYSKCVDPDGRVNSPIGCRAEYWKKYLIEKSTLQ